MIRKVHLEDLETARVDILRRLIIGTISRKGSDIELWLNRTSESFYEGSTNLATRLLEKKMSVNIIGEEFRERSTYANDDDILECHCEDEESLCNLLNLTGLRYRV
jgi:hypothetical protein